MLTNALIDHIQLSLQVAAQSIRFDRSEDVANFPPMQCDVISDSEFVAKLNRNIRMNFVSRVEHATTKRERHRVNVNLARVHRCDDARSNAARRQYIEGFGTTSRQEAGPRVNAQDMESVSGRYLSLQVLIEVLPIGTGSGVDDSHKLAPEIFAID